MGYKSFEEIPLWRESIELTKKVYSITNFSDISKDFALKDQIRRSVISISSNIVEGYEKNNNNEFIRFLTIAKGSCGELRNQFYIAYEIGYLPEPVFLELNELLKLIGGKIGGFISYLKGERKMRNFIKK